MTNTERIHMDDIMAIERPYDRRPVYKISWKMTDLCPYACSYCYMSNAVAKAKALKSSPKQEDINKIASQFDKVIEKFASPKDAIQLHLIGGEPSIYNLIELLEQVKSPQLRYVNIASNLYRDKEYWRELYLYSKERGLDFGVSASFHLEALDTEKKRNEYIDKILEVPKIQCKAVVNNDNLQIYKPYFERLIENQRSIEITLERDSTNKCCKLSEENQEFVDYVRRYQYKLREEKIKGYLPYYTVTLKDGKQIGYSSNIALINSIEEGALDPTGFTCTAGLHNIRVEKDGSLKRSACRLCSMYYKLGSIFDLDNIKKPEDEVICKTYEAGKDSKYQTKYCTCFNNTSMYRLGYDRLTGEYNPNHGIEIPDYYKLRYVEGKQW